MTDTSSHESEYEPTFSDVILIFGLLILWGLAFCFGLFVGKLLIMGSSFIFLVIAVVIRTVGFKSTFSLMEALKPRFLKLDRPVTQPTDSQFSSSQTIAGAAAVPVIIFLSLMLVALLFPSHQSHSTGEGWDFLFNWLAYIVRLTCIGLVMAFLSILVVSMIHSRESNEEFSLLSILRGIMLSMGFIIFITCSLILIF